MDSVDVRICVKCIPRLIHIVQYRYTQYNLLSWVEFCSHFTYMWKTWGPPICLDIDAKMLLVRRKVSLNHWPSPEMHIIETERRARARQTSRLHLRWSWAFCTESLAAPPPSSCAGIFRQSMGARNRVGIGLSYRPARLHRLADLIPWNLFLGSLKV